MSYSEWLLPKKTDNQKATTRHMFYLRNGEEIDRYKNEMLRSGVVPIRYLSQLGIVVAENESTLSSHSIKPYSDVEYVESDIRLTLNEPLLGSIKPLTKHKLPWGIEHVKAPDVWSKTKGDEVKVAVIDTGIEDKHPVIQENCVQGVNILSKKNPPQDYNGHGTHVAGTIAGKSSEIGLIGVAPNAKIFAVKAFNRKGSANLSDLLSAINWCIEAKIQVINMSFGMDKLSDSLRLAIQIAHRKGIIMVAATGNKGYSSKIDFPARYPETIGVTSISKNGKISSFSNLGKGTDIAAPGDNILSAWKNGSTREMSGTSMATPHVAGAAALCLSLGAKLKRRLNPEQIRYILTHSATKSKHLDNNLGILNVTEAIRLVSKM